MTKSDVEITAANLPNAESLYIQLAKDVTPLLKPNTALVGIHSGGVWLLQRLLQTHSTLIEEHHIEHGTLDVSFYRDDYAKRGLKLENKPSQISFDVANKHIILIDDVFYTGRTTRAAMNELFDYGRPASITLVSLVNRGGRELPIAPQIVAATMTLAAHQNLQLLQNTDGTLTLQLENTSKDAEQLGHSHA